MMRRDKEIERLVKYAQGMGVKVLLSRLKNPKEAANWSVDGTEITVFMVNHKTKTDVILSLVHELGHHLDHIHRNNRETDTEFENALDPDKNGEIGRRKRKKILNSEIAGTAYWHTIYKETNLQIPLWKLYAQMEHDIWQYEFYYETGDYPSGIARTKKRREIYAKHKVINYE